MSKQLKAFFIDAKNQTIEEVEWNGELNDVYEHIGCNYIALAYAFGGPGDDVIFVDDEGLLYENPYTFAVRGSHQPLFAGNGLVVGGEKIVNEYGDVENIDVSITLKELEKRITFGGQLGMTPTRKTRIFA